MLVLTAFLLAACEPQDGGISVREVWARPGLGGGNSAVYFVVENSGADDTLLSASSDVAEAVELHQTQMEGDQMHMQLMGEGIPIPAGEVTELAPGGRHVMLIGLKQDLKAGDSFELILGFDMAGELALTVKVQQP